MQDLLAAIEDKIFAYEIDELPGMIDQLMQALMTLLAGKSPEDIIKINQVLELLIKAMQDKDYLLLADTLRYELQPMLGGYYS